jgi:hypothetical protein
MALGIFIVVSAIVMLLTFIGIIFLIKLVKKN